MLDDSDPDVLYLAGNSIHFDRKFIDEYMPTLSSRLHYRMFDVRVLMMAEYMWTTGVVTHLDAASEHRAVSDIEHSLYLARAYRQFFTTHGR